MNFSLTIVSTIEVNLFLTVIQSEGFGLRKWGEGSRGNEVAIEDLDTSRRVGHHRHGILHSREAFTPSSLWMTFS
jgi:hypothetical protein